MDDMIWILDCGRDGLLEILGTNGANRGIIAIPRGALLSLPQASTQMRLIWSSDPQFGDRCPTAIVTERNNAADFLAWATTFLESYTPFSAICRVLDGRDDFELEMNIAQPRLVVPNASVALAIVEALTYGIGRLDSDTLNVATCLGTYSFCRARASAIGSRHRSNLPGLWSEFRKLVMLPERIPLAGEIENIWAVLERVGGGDRFRQPAKSGLFDVGIADACTHLAMKGEVEPKLLSEIIDAPIDWRSIHSAMKSSREERVRVFEQTMTLLGRGLKRNVETLSFSCGYLGSLMSPGMLEYSELVGSHCSDFPTSLLWYGLCCGLHPQSGILNQFGGIGRRVLRDVLAADSLFTRPTSDISLQELRSRVRRSGSTESVRRVIPPSPRIELVPFVWTTLSWRAKLEVQPSHQSQEERELRRGLDNVERAIAGLKATIDRVQPNGAFTSQESPSSPKNKYTRKK